MLKVIEQRAGQGGAYSEFYYEKDEVYAVHIPIRFCPFCGRPMK